MPEVLESGGNCESISCSCGSSRSGNGYRMCRGRPNLYRVRREIYRHSIDILWIGEPHLSIDNPIRPNNRPIRSRTEVDGTLKQQRATASSRIPYTGIRSKCECVGAFQDGKSRGSGDDRIGSRGVQGNCWCRGYLLDPFGTVGTIILVECRSRCEVCVLPILGELRVLTITVGD